MQLSTKQIVHDIERRAARLNLTIGEISKRAKLARSTFQRWKAGEVDPSLPSLNKITRVLDRAEARSAAKG